MSGIRHLVRTRPKNFDAFHRESANCPPHLWVLESALAFKEMGYKVIQVTARSAKYYSVTAFWLAMHGVPSDALYMREDGDFRPDYLVKKDILLNYLHKYEIVCAFDDNPAIIKLWHEYNVECIQVPGWESDE